MDQGSPSATVLWIAFLHMNTECEGVVEADEQNAAPGNKQNEESKGVRRLALDRRPPTIRPV